MSSQTGPARPRAALSLRWPRCPAAQTCSAQLCFANSLVLQVASARFDGDVLRNFCSCSIHRTWTVNLRTSGAPSGLRWLPDKPGGHDQGRTVCPATKQFPEPQNPTAPKQATGLEAGT